MVELTSQQRLELGEEVPRVIDPQTRAIYVLVKEDIWDRLQDLLAPGRLTEAEQRAMLHAAGLRAGWADPETDVYDRDGAEVGGGFCEPEKGGLEWEMW